VKVGPKPPSADVPEPRKIESITEGKPPILDVLGAHGMAPVKAVQRPGGRILWFNWALAEELGLELPKERRLTPELEAKLLSALNLEVLKKGEAPPPGAKVKEGWADYYGGEGLGYNKGSGRAAFFGDLNLNGKGIGVIEEMVSQLTSWEHRHGGMSMLEGGLEAIWGEVGTNLFRKGSTRVIAVLDRGDAIVWKDGGQERRAVAYRFGDQTRPAHLLADEQEEHRFETLIRMLDQSGDLVKTGTGKPDLSASLIRLTEHHARVAAEQLRHRVLHGALSPSNTETDAGMLDYGTASTEPRTAPVRVLDRGESRNALYSFGSESRRRVQHLETLYEIVESELEKESVRDSSSFAPFSVKKRFEAAFTRERRQLMVEAAGLPPELAKSVIASKPKEAARFAEILTQLGSELNEGKDLNIDKKVVTDVSVVDVYKALAEVPKPFFLDPGQDLAKLFEKKLDVRGGTKAQLESISKLTTELAGLYKDLLGTAKKAHEKQGGTAFGFERMVIQRAGFENRATNELFRASLRWRLIQLANEYAGHGDPIRFQKAIDKVIAHSLRSVDAVKRLGGSRVLDDGTRVLEERTIRGVTYAVHLPKEGDSKIVVSVPIEALEGGKVRLPTIDDPATLTQTQLESMRFKYTLSADWSSFDVASGVVKDGELRFEIPSFSSHAAIVEGVFYSSAGELYVHDHSGNFEGYVFAVPDEGET
jgi:hypothetical protein